MKKNISSFLISVLCVCVCAFSLVFSACDSGSGGGGGGGGSSLPGGKSALKITLPTLDSRAGIYEKGDTVKFTVEIASDKYNDSKDGKAGDTVEFNNIPVGEYTVTVIGKDENGNHVSKGTNKATVSAGVSSPVPIKLSVLEYYDVTMLLQSGTSPSSTVIKVTKDEEFKLPECPFKIDGYEFMGWMVQPQPNGFRSADGGDDFVPSAPPSSNSPQSPNSSQQPPSLLQAGEIYELTEDVTFIAVVQLKTYKITYIGTDDASSPSPLQQSFTVEEDVTLPDMFKDQTYPFLGWYDEDGEAVSFADKDEKIYSGWQAGTKTEDVTVYARWGVSSLEALQTELANAENGAIIYICFTIDLGDDTIKAPSGKTVTLKRHSNLSSASPMFEVTSNVTAIFGDSNDSSSKIIIDGNNITCSVPMLNITRGSTKYYNVTFQNAKSTENGGAIYLDRGAADFYNCVFTECQADAGAAIYSSTGNPKLHNSRIENTNTNIRATCQNSDIFASSTSNDRDLEVSDYAGNPSIISSVYLSFAHLIYTKGAVINNLVVNYTTSKYKIFTLNTEGTDFQSPTPDEYSSFEDKGTYTLSSDGILIKR